MICSVYDTPDSLKLSTCESLVQFPTGHDSIVVAIGRLCCEMPGNFGNGYFDEVLSVGFLFQAGCDSLWTIIWVIR